MTSDFSSRNLRRSQQQIARPRHRDPHTCETDDEDKRGRKREVVGHRADVGRASEICDIAHGAGARGHRGFLPRVASSGAGDREWKDRAER